MGPDFRAVYPRYCNICTTHRPSDVDSNWAVTVLAITVGTHLGMNDRSEVERHLLKMKQAGFDFRVMANNTADDVMSDKLDDLPAGIPGKFRTQAILMPDPIKTNPLGQPTFIRFVFYFDEKTPFSKNPDTATCDVCNRSVGANSKKYTRGQFVAAVMEGFRPSAQTLAQLGAMQGMSASDAEAGWFAIAMISPTDWLLCASCASRVKSKKPWWKFW